jgi:hypothetical protein
MTSPSKCPVEIFTAELSNRRGYVAHVRLSGSAKKIHETDPFHTPTAAALEAVEWCRMNGREVIE